VEIMPKKSKGNAFVTLIGVLAMGLVSTPALYAAENDCSALMKSLSKTGEVPAIVINPADETVKIISTRASVRKPSKPGAKGIPRRVVTGNRPNQNPRRRQSRNPSRSQRRSR